MKVARSLSVSLSGLSGTIVEVEAEVGRGLPAFTIVGLPDSSTLQARERVRGSCTAIGHPILENKCTINLSPAWIPKSGSGFDLAIAVAALASLGLVEPRATGNVVFLGELTLDGQVRPVPGILPSLMTARAEGITRAVLPRGNEGEARLVPGIEVEAVSTLEEAVRVLGGPTITLARPSTQERPAKKPRAASTEVLDFLDVVGHFSAKHAAMAVAAGGHHLMMVGPPGAGKSMIAARIPGIMPQLGDEDALTLAAIRSLTGVANASGGLDRTAPFEAPHHGMSLAAMIGGGSGVAQPGAISRAHGGILFLDEAPEFAPTVLDALRQPLESGTVQIHRSKAVVTYPARFQLVLAANPCPCGRYTAAGTACSCSSIQRRRYLTRLSGPIVDRIDARLTLSAITPGAARAQGGMSSAQMRDRVYEARQRQAARLRETPFAANARVSSRFLDERMRLGEAMERTLERSVERGLMTMRGRDRVRRLAWTLADLEGHLRPTDDDVAAALSMRGEDS